jgi:L-ascorbate metabolism protein UlaG (beta-lactamase superfamily)
MSLQLNGTQITWLGHASFKITTSTGKVILIDPFIEQNPVTPTEAKQFDRVDLILVTHGHSDHTADVVSLAKKHQASVLAIVELATWFGTKGVEKTIGMNKGGAYTFDTVTINMTTALHSAGIGDGTEFPYVGEPAGYVLDFAGTSVYFAGDTAPFSDMQIIRELYAPQAAVLPIGDFFTMGPKGAALSTRLLGVKYVVPMHFGTFPVLTGTPAAFREELNKFGLTDVEVIELKPGQTLQ